MFTFVLAPEIHVLVFHGLGWVNYRGNVVEELLVSVVKQGRETFLKNSATKLINVKWDWALKADVMLM